MIVINDCDLFAHEITNDVYNNEQYAQADINGIFDLDMYYNPTQSIIFAIYCGNPIEVNPRATLRQFLDTLLPRDDYEFQLDNYYAPSFTEDPLTMTLEDIHEQAGVFQFNITLPVAI